MDGTTVYHRRQASVPPPRCAPPQSPARAGPPPPATFWTRHPVVSALLHDILLWVRPAATALVYGGLVWLFFILRALVPHGSSSDSSSSSSTSAALFVLGAGAVLGTLALRWAADALGQSPVLACLARAPVLLCAAPRDDAALAARAARVEHTVAAARTRVVAVLTELHLAAGGAAGTPEATAATGATAGAVRLTVLGKTVLGVACLAMALVTSLASTGAVVAVAALVAAVVPPVVHYELVRRFFEALSNASQAAQKQDQQQSKAADK